MILVYFTEMIPGNSRKVFNAVFNNSINKQIFILIIKKESLNFDKFQDHRSF